MSETNSSEGGGDKFYVDAEKYWAGVPATVDGMLGGFSHLSSTDIGGSHKFLRYMMRNHNLGTKRALDCGSGIGRITKLLLTKLFESVDMVELNEDFLKTAKSYLGPQAEKVERLVCCGLQDFTPEDGRYDLIWCQWVLGHLTDDDLIAFLQRCKKGLAPNGIIVAKENVASGENPDFDEDDSSRTRPKNDLVKLLRDSGLKIVKEEKQKNFPKEIYDVYTFALQ